MRVCITDEKSIPFNAANSAEIMESLKKHIIEKEQKGNNLGILGTSENGTIPLNKIAFTYSNPQIIDGKLSVDLKMLDTPMGIKAKELINFRATTEGYGFVKETGIDNYLFSTVVIDESQ